MDEYRVGWAVCGDCGYRWVAIVEPGGPAGRLECPACAAPRGALVARIDPPTAVELRRWSDQERDQYLRAAADLAVRKGYGRERR